MKDTTDYSVQPPSESPVIGFNDSPAPNPKRAKLLIMLGVGLLVVGIGIFVGVRLFTGKDDAAKTIRSVVASASIASGGVSPSTMQVKKGQPITITNQDVRPHHLVADQESLPGFDTVDVLNQGDSYTYIFETSGTFHYYDPADPKMFVGTVTVE